MLDQIILVDGSIVEGIILQNKKDYVNIICEIGSVKISKSKIERIENNI